MKKRMLQLRIGDTLYISCPMDAKSLAIAGRMLEYARKELEKEASP